MRSSDWSSDVCSSDLRIQQPRHLVDPVAGYAAPEAGQWRSTQSAKRCVPEAYREAGEPMARKAAQPAGEAVDPVAQPCRQGVAAIAAEELVAAVAGKADRHLGAGKPRDLHRGYR